MQSKVNYTLVGLFVVALVAAFSLAVFWLTLGGENKVYDRYRVYFRESVAGLNPKATVRYRGVQVGQVESIRLDPANPDQVDVVLAIEQGTPIRRDTIATLSTRGLTGVASVELSGDSAQSPPLEKKPDQELPVIQAGPSLVARLDDAFNNILTNVNSLSGRLERLLGDDNQTTFTTILHNVSTVTGALAGHSDQIGQAVVNVETFTSELVTRVRGMGKTLDHLLAGLEKSGDLGGQVQGTLTDFRASAQAARKLIEGFDSQAQGTLADFRAAAQSVRKTADTFNQTSLNLSSMAKDGQRELQRMGQSTLPELNELLAQASELVKNLRQLAELLEQNPRSLLLGKPTGRPGPGEK
ncbi:MAG: MlaD family protein [Candidatus Contendobacter sp.]